MSEITLEEITKLAKCGSEFAQCHLGWTYASGFGVKQNSEEAVKWYTLAAEQGNTDAKQELCELYIKRYVNVNINN